MVNRNYNDFIRDVGFTEYKPTEIKKINMPVFGDIKLNNGITNIDGMLMASDLTGITTELPKEETTLQYNFARTPEEDNLPTIQLLTSINKSVTGDKKYAMDFFYNRLLLKNKNKENAELLSHIQAAGVVGNLIQESGLRTEIKGDGGKALGIALWHPDRQKGLKVLADSRGVDITDFDIQLEYIWQELNSTEKKAFDALLNSTNIDLSTAAFMKFERPGNPLLEKRINYAKSLLA